MKLVLCSVLLAGSLFGSGALAALLPDGQPWTQPITVAAEGTDVSELLAAIGKTAGLSLGASGGAEDEKVILFCAAQAARAVRQDLARLYDYDWVPRQSPGGRLTYTLVRGPRAQARDQHLNRREAEQVVAHLDAYVRALDEPEEVLLRRAPQYRIRSVLSSPPGRMGVACYSAMSPAQKVALVQGGRLNVRFASLAPPQQVLLRRAWKENLARLAAAVKQLRAENPGQRFIVEEERDLERGSLRFRALRTGGRLMVGLVAGAVPYRAEVSEDGAHSSGWPIAALDARMHWLLPPHGDPYAAQPDSGVVPVLNPSVLPAAAREKSLTRALRALAERSGCTVAADFYRTPALTRAVPPAALGKEPPPEAPPLEAQLDTLCEPHGYLWWSNGRTLLFRKRDWYRQREYEIPDPWLRTISETIHARKGVPDYRDLQQVSGLTSAQIAGLIAIGRGAPPADEEALAALPELLTLAAPRFRQGGAIPVGGGPSLIAAGNLLPAQKARLAAVIEDQQGSATAADLLAFTFRAAPAETGGAAPSATPGIRLKLSWVAGEERSAAAVLLWLPLQFPARGSEPPVVT